MRSRFLAVVCVGVMAPVLACSAPDAPPELAATDIEAGPEVDETADELTSLGPLWYSTPELAACPTGARFDANSGLCTVGEKALGPFPQGMVDACRKGGGAACEDASWPLAQAVRFRGVEPCPLGSSIERAAGVCADGTYVYGPVDRAMVRQCRALGGGDACTSMRFERRFVAAIPNEDAPEPQLSGRSFSLLSQDSCEPFNERLFAYYSSEDGYSAVSRAGFRTLGTRRNGCATWLSHAIRQSGESIPVNTGTEGLRDVLLARRWTTIRSREELQPGDVIVTKDRKGRPGHPDHVYMFAGWSGSAPLAVDNQGNTHVRGPGKSPIAYGLRAPASSNPSCDAPSSPPAEAPPGKDTCDGKVDGWYCSELEGYSAYECADEAIVGGWQCTRAQVCRKDRDGQALMAGDVPECF